MNRLSIVSATLLAVAGTTCQPSRAKEHLVYDAGHPLLSLHGPDKQNAFASLDVVLHGLLSADAAGAPVPLVVYIHGRGNEPSKSFQDSFLKYFPATGFGRNQVLAKIETDDVHVLGFNWNSKSEDLLCGRPIEKAQESAAAFAELLKAITTHRSAHPDAWRGRKLVLLVHSMGSFVLEAAEKLPGVAGLVQQLFDVRLITESDSPAKGHTAWLPVGPPGMTYVVSSPADKILARSMSCELKHDHVNEPRLGVLPAEDQLTERAAGATYIDLPLGGTHRVFTRGGSGGNPLVCNTLRRLMRGEVPALEPTWQVGGKSNILRIPVADSKTDDCVKGVSADDDPGD